MVALPPPSQPTVDAIWDALEEQAKGRPSYTGYGVSASALGYECDRRLWYDLRWASTPDPIPGRTLRIFERGNWEEDRIVDLLKLAGLNVDEVDPATGRQWRFSLASGWIRGKADGRCTGVIEAPTADHVIEIKSMKAADWRGIKKHGLHKHKPEHWHQLHAGMAGLGIERGLYIATNKDTEEILTERLRLDPEEATRQEQRVLRLIGDDPAPLRISDKPDFFGCRFCPHLEICHSGRDAPRSCRSCLHFTFSDGPNGHCARFNEPRKPDRQREGAQCPAHLYLPDLVPGEQIDANPELETVTYKMQDGSVWTDGGQPHGV